MAANYLFLTPTSDRPDDYFDADEVIDFGHPAIEELADRLELRFGGPDLKYGDMDAVSYAEAAFAFVRDEIAHSVDVDLYSTAYRASDVLRRRNALCFGKAHLLTALLRAKGIPAGLCYQRITDFRGPYGFHLHCLVATRIVGWWSRLDPRGNKPGTHAWFDLYDARLAYTVDPTRGEVDYADVHPSPPLNLRAALRAARPGPGVYALLPTEPA